VHNEILEEDWKRRLRSLHLPWEKDARLQITLTEAIRLAIHFAKERQGSANFGFSHGVLAGLFAVGAGEFLHSGGWTGWIAAVALGAAAWYLWRTVSTCEEDLLAILRKRLREAKAWPS
jgi:hypothetical protein